jgi:hypothetical protein
MALGRKTGGRTKGTPNKTTGEVAERCRALIESESYQQYFQHRLQNGALPPALEALTWYYAYGKPKERMEVTGAGGGPVIYAWQA